MSLDSDEDDFVEYGNPVEQFDEETLPRKKAVSVNDQVATDKHGRRRFHGAFTGGFSAGFFNTVGSLEGWTPSAFKSSRSDKAKVERQKPEDFMDEEDMDEFGIAPKVLQATSDFNDSREKRKRIHQLSDGPIPGEPVLSELLRIPKHTIGIKLLMKMGWKPGQGIGPRVTKAEKKIMKEEYERNKTKIYGCSLPQEMSKTIHSDSDNNSTDDENYENITFAPEDFLPVLCKPKDNVFGLGFSGLDRRPVLSSHINLFEPTPLKMSENEKKVLIAGQAFGVGAFEDEDEDIYCQEDMSQYDFSLESASKTSKQKSKEPSLKTLPDYSRDVLEGFILGSNTESFKKYFPPPLLPHGYQPLHKSRISRFEPIADDSLQSGSKAKESKNTEKKGFQHPTITAVDRAAILGDPVSVGIKVENVEKCGISTATDKLVVSTKLGYSNFKPFAGDPEKEKRYEQYLELLKKGQKEKLSYYQPLTMTEWERERERVEFDKAAVLYQPLSGMMSDRFVSASQPDDLNAPLKKPVDEEGDKRKAAKMKMFGQLTREESDWRPCSLLCKRFNVPELYPGSGETSNVKNKSSKFSVFSFLDDSSFNKTLKSSIQTQSDQPESESIPANETSDNAVTKTEELPIQEHQDNSPSEQLSLQKIKDTELEFADPPAKIDLFKAIFLSSSEDSDSQSEEEETQIKEVPQVVKELDLETKNILEDKETDLSVKKDCASEVTHRNLSPPRGVFANLDLDAVNRHRKDRTENFEGTDIDSGKDMPDNISNVQEMQSSDVKDVYGPVLPSLSSVAVKSSPSYVLPSVVASRGGEWVEKTKKDIQQDKHRKHKKSSKPKKHKKSKHRKKKH